MQNKPFRAGPVALANAAADILNPGTTTGGVNCTAAPYNKLRLYIKKVTLVNKTAGAVTASLFIGATGGSAAGTEFLVSATSIPANTSIPYYCNSVPLETTDFLSGLAGASASITIEIEGEIGLA